MLGGVLLTSNLIADLHFTVCHTIKCMQHSRKTSLVSTFYKNACQAAQYVFWSELKSGKRYQCYQHVTSSAY